MLLVGIWSRVRHVNLIMIQIFNLVLAVNLNLITKIELHYYFSSPIKLFTLILSNKNSGSIFV